MKNLKYEFDKLNDIECIAFDIFDTIITRDVHPEYVKKIWAKEIANLLGILEKKELVYKYRNQIEAEICTNNKVQNYDLEFKYEEMLEKLFDKLSNNLKIEKSRFIKIGLQLEIDTELRVQNIDRDWLDFIEYAKSQGKRIICISDFYLINDQIAKLFEEHKILKYIDKIYTSSDVLLTKRSGRLYPYVLENEKINPKNILMVGDNQHSDYNMAIEYGMNAYHIDRVNQHEFYTKHENNVKNTTNIINSISQISHNKKMCYFDNAVYSLYSFIDLLYSKLLKDGVKDVFFLSREGEFLKKIFDEYRRKQNYKGTQFIKSHYLIVSRKSTFLPSLKSLDEETFENLFRQYRRISLYDFLSSLNFEEEKIHQIALGLNVNVKEKQEDFPTSNLFEQLKQDSTFINYYNTRRIEQNNNFKKYVAQYGVDIEKTGLNIVDVGWKGTIQDNIFNIYEGGVVVRGYYTGLIAEGNANSNNLKSGLLFNNIKQKTKYFDVYNENRAIFEMLLSASHGSANGYINKDEVVSALTYEEKEEKELYENVTKDIQDKIYNKFSDILNAYAKTIIEYNDYEKQFAKKHANMVFYPTKNETEFFRKMYHFENFGVFEFTTFQKNNISIALRAKNLKTLLLNPKSIMNRGFWGPITLEDQGLGSFKKIYGHYRMYRNFGGVK